MKKSQRVVFFLFFIPFLNGCTPNVQTNYTFDTNVFFSITFNGTTLKSYRLETVAAANLASVSINQSSDGQGHVVYSIQGWFPGEIYKGVLGSSFYDYNLQYINCDAMFNATKIGNSDPLGIYDFSSSGSLLISDLRESVEKGYTNANSSTSNKINITSITNQYIEGTFTCILLDIDGVTQIPASGSFRMLVKQ